MDRTGRHAVRPFPPSPARLAPARRRQSHVAEPRRAKVRRHTERFKVRDEFGECVVARFHGQYGDKTALILPDGQLGTPNRLVPTDEPFQPLTADQLETVLQEWPVRRIPPLEDRPLPDLLQVDAGVRAG